MPPELSQSDYPSQQRGPVEMQKRQMIKPAGEERQPRRARILVGTILGIHLIPTPEQPRERLLRSPKFLK